MIAFGRLAEICADYLTKGRLVFIEGKLRTREWEGRDGLHRYTTEVVADTLQMLSPDTQSAYDRQMGKVLVLVGVLGPLAMDTFAISAALGIVGLKPRERLRISLIMAAFEGGMPILGFVLGGIVGRILGGYAEYAAIAFLVLAGALLLWPGNEDAEEERLRLLSRAKGLAAINLGLAVSVDELTIGFSLGLLGISVVVAVVWIAVQALIAAQLGMRLGARVGDQLRERAEQLAGVVLIGMAVVLLVLKLTGRS